MKKILATVLVLAILLTAAFFALDYMGKPEGEEASALISQGMGGREVAKLLEEKGVIYSALFFEAYLRISGESTEIKAGEHRLRKNMPYKYLLESLSKSPMDNDVITVTIPEGYELRQIADKLEEAGLINRNKFYEEVEKGVFPNEFIKDIPKRENRLEGYLFPDTYQFSKKMTEHDIIEKMLNRFDEIMTEEHKKRAKEMGFSVDKIVTLASVIEREAGNKEEAAKVSSVFHNRLNSKTYPYLESCATVQYILKERKPVLSKADTKIDSPYNTYQNKGLPIGPIASPGESSIKAALYPDSTEYYFFVVGKNGEHIFSKTFEEHLRAAN